MRNVTCHSGHAVVPVNGQIGEDMMLPLVAAIKQLHREYFYAHIELDVCSPGGQVQALDYCVETMDNLLSIPVENSPKVPVENSPPVD